MKRGPKHPLDSLWWAAEHIRGSRLAPHAARRLRRLIEHRRAVWDAQISDLDPAVMRQVVHLLAGVDAAVEGILAAIAEATYPVTKESN